MIFLKFTFQVPHYGTSLTIPLIFWFTWWRPVPRLHSVYLVDCLACHRLCSFGIRSFGGFVFLLSISRSLHALSPCIPSYSLLVYVVIGIFVIGTISASVSSLSYLVSAFSIPDGCTKDLKCCGDSLKLTLTNVVVFIISLSLSLLWLFTRHHELNWILQNTLGFLLVLSVFRVVRLSNLKVPFPSRTHVS